jgi:hypothetical protein
MLTLFALACQRLGHSTGILGRLCLSVPGRPDMTMTLEPSTVAVICSISRNTGSPAGPLPTTLIGKSTRTMLPLPAIVVKLGACRNTHLARSLLGRLQRVNP